MIAVIFRRVEALARVERQNLQPRLAKELDRRAPPGARADHDDVVDSFALLDEPHSWTSAQYRARKQAAVLSVSRLLTRAALFNRPAAADVYVQDRRGAGIPELHANTA